MKKIASILVALATSTTLAIAADPSGAQSTSQKCDQCAAGGGEHHGDPGGMHHNRAEVFKKLDANNDGKLSQDEFLAGKFGKADPAKAAEHFKKLDTNNDGFLSLDEFTAGKPHHEHEGAPK